MKLRCFDGEFCINMTESQCEALSKQKKKLGLQNYLEGVILEHVKKLH